MHRRRHGDMQKFHLVRRVIDISDPDENFSLREMLYALASEFLTFFADAIILILIISLFF